MMTEAPLAVTLAENWNYLVVITLMMSGLFIVISRFNLVKKLVGLAPGRNGCAAGKKGGHVATSRPAGEN